MFNTKVMEICSLNFGYDHAYYFIMRPLIFIFILFFVIILSGLDISTSCLFMKFQ
jgi:hypothetical protein